MNEKWELCDVSIVNGQTNVVIYPPSGTTADINAPKKLDDVIVQLLADGWEPYASTTMTTNTHITRTFLFRRRVS